MLCTTLKTKASLAPSQVISQSLFIPVCIGFYSEDARCNYFWVVGVNPVTIPVMGATLSMGPLVFFVVTNYFFVVRVVVHCVACVVMHAFITRPQIDVFLNFITGAVDEDNNTVQWGFSDIRCVGCCADVLTVYVLILRIRFGFICICASTSTGQLVFCVCSPNPLPTPHALPQCWIPQDLVLD